MSKNKTHEVNYYRISVDVFVRARIKLGLRKIIMNTIVYIVRFCQKSIHINEKACCINLLQINSSGTRVENFEPYEEEETRVLSEWNERGADRGPTAGIEEEN